MLEEGDNVRSDIACVLRPSADPKMCPGWLKSALESYKQPCFNQHCSINLVTILILLNVTLIIVQGSLIWVLSKDLVD